MIPQHCWYSVATFVSFSIIKGNQKWLVRHKDDKIYTNLLNVSTYSMEEATSWVALIITLNNFIAINMEVNIDINMTGVQLAHRVQ